MTWTKRDKPLPSSDKYQHTYDPKSGHITLLIQDIGPGDEGQYSCTVSNEYGSITANLNVNPDINGLNNRCLSPGCCRASLQRKMKQRVQHQEQNGHQHTYTNGDLTLWSICVITLKKLSKKYT